MGFEFSSRNRRTEQPNHHTAPVHSRRLHLPCLRGCGFRAGIESKRQTERGLLRSYTLNHARLLRSGPIHGTGWQQHPTSRNRRRKPTANLTAGAAPYQTPTCTPGPLPCVCVRSTSEKLPASTRLHAHRQELDCHGLVLIAATTLPAHRTLTPQAKHLSPPSLTQPPDFH